MNKHIMGACIGDIHLGNTRNPTDKILKNLYKYITPQLFKKLDLFVINGDLFDRDVPLGSKDAELVAKFDKYLNDMAKKHNVYLYYLKGTFTHDYNQIKTLTEYNDSYMFKYIDKIDVVYNAELGLYIGFIPDDTGHNPIEVERILQDKMINVGVSSLDLLFIHGSFDYQLPIKLEDSYTKGQFRFVKYYIIINHIHKHSVMDNIIAPGSFDRLTFGEEEMKGFIVFNLSPTGDKSFSFIENKNTMKFNTIDISSSDINYWNDYIIKHIKKYKPENVRLRIYDMIDTTILKETVKRLGVNVKVKNETDNPTHDETEDNSVYVYKELTKETLVHELKNIILSFQETHEKLLKDIL